MDYRRLRQDLAFALPASCGRCARPMTTEAYHVDNRPFALFFQDAGGHDLQARSVTKAVSPSYSPKGNLRSFGKLAGLIKLLGGS
jgi:hypothetical protein